MLQTKFIEQLPQDEPRIRAEFCKLDVDRSGFITKGQFIIKLQEN